MTNEQIIEVYQRELSRYKDNIKHENTGESDECWDFGSFLLSRDDDNPKLWWPQAVIHIPATRWEPPDQDYVNLSERPQKFLEALLIAHAELEREMFMNALEAEEMVAAELGAEMRDEVSGV